MNKTVKTFKRILKLVKENNALRKKVIRAGSLDCLKNYSVLPPSPPDMNLWFELSYARFLTVPRLVLESMPMEWQHKLAALLFEMDETFDWRPKEGRYWVKLKDSHGRYIQAPLGDYRRGHAEIEKLRKKDVETKDPSTLQWSKKQIKEIISQKRVPISFNSISVKAMEKTSRISLAMRGNNEIRGI